MRNRSSWLVLLALAAAPAFARAQDTQNAQNTEPSAATTGTAEPSVDANAEPSVDEHPYADITPEQAAAASSPPATLPIEEPSIAEPPAVSEATEAQLAPGIPLHFQLHGYFRTRLVWGNGWPTERSDFAAVTDPENNPAYGFMRGRFEPAILYGSDPKAPIAAFRTQIDAFDNVVFGDNVRNSGTPLFVDTPSLTDVDAQDVFPIRIRRMWMEFNIPIGQIRVGRQGSHGGVGILFNDGDGFKNDWGDAQYGTTFDRVLFATRPLTIFNAITRGDTRPTPLIFAIAHDWLVEDPLGLARDPRINMYGQPLRSQIPFANLGRGADDVGQAFAVLAWNQPGHNPERPTDEISAGLVGAYRYQNLTSSEVYIADVYWKLRHSFFGRRGPQLFTNGEVYTIQGGGNALPLGMAIDPETGRTPDRTGAGIWGAAVQAGVANDGWEAKLEYGHSSGDGDIFDPNGNRTLTQRPNSPDYRVGLLMYPVALNVRTANAYTTGARALWSRGGVWNSSYLFPQVRYRVVNGVELKGAFLLAWADQLNEAYPTAAAERSAGGNEDRSCKVFSGECFLGWELDLGVNVTWGDNDMMRWSTEFGVMDAGGALALELQQDLMWTLQSRIAMVF
jgi:hypothetical protein